MAYTPRSWADGELVTAEDLNRIEQGLTEPGPPTAHTHPITDVDGLKAIIDQLTVGTGWRDISESISALSFPGIGDEAVISRVGPSVEIAIRGRAVGSLAAGFDLFTVPSGFRGRGYQYRGMAFNLSTGEMGQVRANSTTASLNTYISATDNQRVMVQCSYRTDDAWPASLPGDPT